MDVNRAFNVPFQDQEWAKKAAFGGLWTMLIVTSPFLYGYWLEYVRDVANGRELPLPKWGDYGRLWVRGFLLYLGLFIYSLPAFVLFVIGFAPLIGAAVSGSSSEGFMAAASGAVCLFSFLAVAWLVAVSIIAYAALVNYSMRENFGAMFAFGEIIGNVKKPGYWTAWGLSIVVWIAAGVVAGIVNGVLGIVPVLGFFAGMFVSGFAYYIAIVMSGHLLGQWAASVYGTPGLGAAAGPSMTPPPPPGMAPQQPAAPGTPPPPPAPPAEPAVPPPPSMPPEPPAGPPPEGGGGQ